MVSPVTVQVVAAAVGATDVEVQMRLPGVEVTVYLVIVAPLEAGAVHAITAWPLLTLAVTVVGAPGRVEGTAAGDAADAVPVPTPLVAVTVNV